MGEKKKRELRLLWLRFCMTMALSVAWWGILYPNLSLNQDTFHTIYANDEEADQTALYFKMLNAKPGEIKLKCRLLETFAKDHDKDK